MGKRRWKLSLLHNFWGRAAMALLALELALSFCPWRRRCQAIACSPCLVKSFSLPLPSNKSSLSRVFSWRHGWVSCMPTCLLRWHCIRNKVMTVGVLHACFCYAQLNCASKPESNLECWFNMYREKWIETQVCLVCRLIPVLLNCAATSHVLHGNCITF